MATASIIEALYAVLQSRKSAAPDTSYVAGLYSRGINRILEKIGEEATEVIIAGKDAAVDPIDPDTRQAVVNETADLWFHTLVMLSHLDIPADELLGELEKRFGVSGIEEKAAREK